MITIYHLPRTRSTRIVWLMEELGEEYRTEALTFPVSEEFLKIHSLGSIPAISDDGLVMCESIAIMQYITGRRLDCGLAIGAEADPALYAAYLQFLHFGEADLTAPAGVIFRTRMLAGEQSNASIADQAAQLGKRLKFLGEHLSDGRDFVCADQFTIADISLGYGLGLIDLVKLEAEWPESVRAYWQRLQERPAFKRATGG